MDQESYAARMKWFQDARFGMFIHWGIYAIPARGEWVASQERIPQQEYQKYFEQWNPRSYDPKAWARLAREAGMKYAVLTAKHHDGFCLFDSSLTDYKSVNTACGRDLVREYLDAFRAEGIKVGLYYSLLDWHHPDYPHYGDRNHPERDNEAYRDRPYDFDRYLAYMHGQVRELLTNYGRIDLLWLDYSYDDMRGEKWKAAELVKMIRSLQPDIILNNRLEAGGTGFGSLITDHPSEASGDFLCPEQIIPPQGLRNVHGDPVPWEACITINNNWGYCRADEYYKTPDIIIRKLAECVSKGGNLLVNVGPDADGMIPQPEIDTLRGVGSWMSRNSESIYGCGFSGIAKPEYGRITRSGNRLYYHVMEPEIGGVPLDGITLGQVAGIRLLHDGRTLKPADSWMVSNYPDHVFVDLGPEPQLPDPVDTVIEVTLK
jgi:alpha-L-fucosidase